MTKTFSEWLESAILDESLEYGVGKSRQRDIYTIEGQKIFVETHFPYNIFKKISISVKAVDFNITKYSDTMKEAAKTGALWEQGYYAETGYGWPVWNGEDGMEKCYNFITSRK